MARGHTTGTCPARNVPPSVRDDATGVIGHRGRTLRPGADRTVVESRETRFEALYRAHYRAVRAYLLRRIDPETAQDALAETFLVAWRRLDEVPPHTRAWLYGVARRILAAGVLVLSDAFDIGGAARRRGRSCLRCGVGIRRHLSLDRRLDARADIRRATRSRRVRHRGRTAARRDLASRARRRHAPALLRVRDGRRRGRLVSEYATDSHRTQLYWADANTIASVPRTTRGPSRAPRFDPVAEYRQAFKHGRVRFAGNTTVAAARRIA